MSLSPQLLASSGPQAGTEGLPYGTIANPSQYANEQTNTGINFLASTVQTVVGGVAVIAATASSVSFSGSIDFLGALAGANYSYGWSTRAVLKSPADATLRLMNNAETIFVDLAVSALGLTTVSRVIVGAIQAGTGDGGFYADVGQASLRNDIFLGFSSTTNPTGVNDTRLVRVEAGVLGLRGTSSSVGGALGLIEQTAPAAPAANGVYLYAQDNGVGKTQLMARFATGVAQQVAIEP